MGAIRRFSYELPCITYGKWLGIRNPNVMSPMQKPLIRIENISEIPENRTCLIHILIYVTLKHSLESIHIHLILLEIIMAIALVSVLHLIIRNRDILTLVFFPCVLRFSSWQIGSYTIHNGQMVSKYVLYYFGLT